MPTIAAPHTVLAPDEGLRLQSGPGRDPVFKVTGEDTGGALDYFTVEVGPKGGPPLHLHHKQEETIHVLKGRFKVASATSSSSSTKAALRICRPKSRTPSST
jgi:quercetin dioxygenase-like cupin family protein